MDPKKCPMNPNNREIHALDRSSWRSKIVNRTTLRLKEEN
jgi:hypothetical protein